MIDDEILEKLTVNTNTLITRAMSTMTPETLSDSRYCHISTVDIAGMFGLQIIFLLHVYKDNSYTVRGIQFLLSEFSISSTSMEYI